MKDPNFYHYKITKDEYVGYGMKIDNLKKYLIIRSEFVISNKTSRVYKIRFMNSE